MCIRDSLPSEEEVRIGDYKVLVTHGHGYYAVSYTHLDVYKRQGSVKLH